jgi:hypothetical protein
MSETPEPGAGYTVALPKNWWLVFLLGIGGGATGGLGFAQTSPAHEARIASLEAKVLDLSDQVSALENNIQQLLIGQALMCQSMQVDCYPPSAK